MGITITLGTIGLIALLFVDWYIFESMSEHRAQINQEYVPDCTKTIKINPDGTRDYSELVSEFLEEHKQAKKNIVEKSNIKGTEAEMLLTSLQKELAVVEDLSSTCENKEPVYEIKNELVSKKGFSNVTTKPFDLQERIYELRGQLNSFSQEDSDLEDFEYMLSAQYELYRLEGKELELEQLERNYPMYFPKKSTSKKQKVYKGDILCIEDMRNPINMKPFNMNDRAGTSKVSDYVMGKQKWLGRIIGVSEKFIHFYDGSRRIWINVGNRTQFVEIGDELLLHVNRTKRQIDVIQMIRITKFNTEKQIVNC